MNIEELYIISPTKRRNKLKAQLLELPENFKSLSINNKVVCIEDRSNGRYGLVAWKKGNYNKVKTLTYGKSYDVVEIKRETYFNRIRLIGDDGALRWYGLKRFAFSIKKQRKEKLEQIFKTIK